jgi:hypothetical protein
MKSANLRLFNLIKEPSGAGFFYMRFSGSFSKKIAFQNAVITRKFSSRYEFTT